MTGGDGKRYFDVAGFVEDFEGPHHAVACLENEAITTGSPLTEPWIDVGSKPEPTKYPQFSNTIC
jgi:hypothetical protein